MIDETLRKLIEAIQNAAPVVWDAALRQAQADGIVALIWVALALLIFLALGYWMYKDWDDSVDGIVLILWLSIGSIFIITLTNGIRYLYNPQWYAIEKLLTLVK